MIEPVLADPTSSDVKRDCEAIAISYHHFLERLEKSGHDVRLLRTPDSDVISDLANSAKHGVRSNPARTVETFATAVFEFRDRGEFSFLKIELTARYPDGREYSVYELLAGCANRTIQQLSFPITPVPTVVSADSNWCNEVRLWATEKTVHTRQVRYKFVKRDEFGDLVVADPPDFTFVVY